ncbi:cytochrome P450 6a2-like [Athalia rosae]|uniref:cytochrome P450 6a2-like n=1 Tax=Athalia rosae TaxID=37344 RepID=UPI00203443FC|nr:cytochrome P450 6a2-like [Athalia rosae]
MQNRRRTAPIFKSLSQCPKLLYKYAHWRPDCLDQCSMSGHFGLVEILGAILLIFIGIRFYLVKNYNYWKKLGIPGPEPELFFGNFKDIALGKAFYGDVLHRMCNQFPDAPMFGIYENRTPRLVLKDLDLIRDVLIKDFACFSERGEDVDEKIDPLDNHLATLETKRWRYLRSKLSPQFTSGRMKKMFLLIQECADQFEKYLHVVAEKSDSIDCREISAKYTTDVIGSCAFGIQSNAIADEDSEFRNIGKKVFAVTPRRKYLMLIRSTLPWLYKLLGKSTTPPEVLEFFNRTVKEMLDYRTETGTKRGDLIDTLNELKQEHSKTDFELSDNLITAQAFAFFVGGFETSASTISNALYELAQRQDIQDKVRQEILESLGENNGSVNYESVKTMKYLNMVFQETLRLRPPAPLVGRAATTDYTFRGTGITIPKRLKVFIPIMHIHMDPNYYPNPEIFEPERFSDENVRARHAMAWLAFGDGPRNCLGSRFAVYQTQLGLIKVLSNFKVETCAKTKIPYEAAPGKMLLEPIGGIHLKFTKIVKS